MYLRSLEMHGFKSFPDKVRLDFDKGITAVVGPNGSGKSNIGDAMRWVMGEQSSKTLRGGKMEDVIFAGTQLRKSVGFAQVTLTIDNTDRALDVENDIVSISRKLYRNGDSEYIINGENVRLKDITELFMDTGLGRDGYSIIGQGRIADIVSSKSTDRREIFEEAAGISKFRYKKEEAERKLVSAEDNISRITDILAELESRLGPLKNQSEKAKKFIVIEEEKRGLEISLWVLKLDEHMESIRSSDEKLKLVKEQYEQIDEEIQKLDDDIEEAFLKSAECQQKAEELKNKIHQTELENTQSASRIAVLENDIEHIGVSISEIEEQISSFESNTDYLSDKLSAHKKTLKELEAKLEENKALEKTTEDSFADILSSADGFNKELGDVNEELSRLYIEKSSLGFRIENNKNTADELEERLKKIGEDIKTDEQTEKELSDELKQKRSELRRRDDELSEHKNKLGGYELLLKNKAQKLEAKENEIRSLENELIQVQQRLNILKDLESSMEGFSSSVKTVIKASNQGRLSGICGSVAQLVTTESKYNIAIETALGAAMQNMITDDENAAKRAIKFLKEKRAGRATFLPLTSVKGNRIENSQLQNEEGFVALGCDIVKYDSRFDTVIKYLLGRVCIAENIDLGANIAKKYGYKFKICTLDGQVINAGGSFTGGSASKSAGILSRKNEIDELSAKQQTLSQDLNEKKESTVKLRQECMSLTAFSDGEKETISNLENEKLVLNMELDTLSEKRKGIEDRLDNAEEEIDELHKRLVNNEKDIDEALTSLSKVNKRIDDNEVKLASGKDKLDDLRRKRENLTEQLSNVRIVGAETLKDIELTKASIEQTMELISQADLDRTQNSEKILDFKNRITEKTAEIESIRQRVASSAGEVKDIENEITSVNLKRNAYNDSGEKSRSLQRIKLDEKENLQGQLSRLEESVKSVTNDYDRIVAQLFESYELTRSQAVELADKDINVIEANSRLNELKNKIKSLGHVNLASIEEYAEVSERFENMSVQLDDVNNSRIQLMQLIDDLTEKMKEIFTESFDRINKNFKVIFTELFGGGRAELSLADPENVLECGIDIRVAPPGKVIKNLVSLSGGEQAFVAIAIYFAILAIRPSPFCLLDEIEAALDDVNVVKYAQYLHRFTDKTQFITVTHRRGTMEEADILYGVTMQQGISKLLRMSPDEAYNMDT